jgi:light-regulated signal transduction histidine kinase (bacteriophytochrome)
VAGLRWILRDITDRKEAEENVMRLNVELEQRVKERTAALEAANRELEAFSYSVSHDLRAPLRSINGFSKAVLEEYADKLDEQGVKYLQYAHDASVRMGHLIEDLLELSRVSRGELLKDRIDLTNMFKAVSADLASRYSLRKVELAVQDGLWACADTGLMRVAIENLLSNAWKFTNRRERARVEVGFTINNERPCVFIRDNGAGFDMAAAHRLFGVFQRLHSQESFPGTGIGLATVRRIIHRHGGEIWAEGRPGEGATFYFTLPEIGCDFQAPVPVESKTLPEQGPTPEPPSPDEVRPSRAKRVTLDRRAKPAAKA